MEKELDKLATDRERMQRKLGNAQFVARAPAAVVQKEQDKLTDMEAMHQALTEQYEKMRQLAE